MSITGSGLRLLLLATAVLLEQPLVENAGAAEPTGEGKDALHPKEVLPQVGSTGEGLQAVGAEQVGGRRTGALLLLLLLRRQIVRFFSRNGNRRRQRQRLLLLLFDLQQSADAAARLKFVDLLPGLFRRGSFGSGGDADVADAFPPAAAALFGVDVADDAFAAADAALFGVAVAFVADVVFAVVVIARQRRQRRVNGERRRGGLNAIGKDDHRGGGMGGGRHRRRRQRWQGRA